MKSVEIKRLINEGEDITRNFCQINLFEGEEKSYPAGTYCREMSRILEPLRQERKVGIRAVLQAGGVGGAIHETLHQGVNKLLGIPSKPRVVVAEDTKEVFLGVDLVPEKARKTPNLAVKLTKAHRFHRAIDKSSEEY